MLKGPINEAIKPLSWLIGQWKSISASGKYMTINPFTYCEELSFESIGQPMLNYSSRTWHPQEKKPMHLESGFLRIKPNTKEVSFLVAHNFGLTSVEEGVVDGYSLNLKSSSVSRMSFAKDPAVIGIERTYQLNEKGELEFVLLMETEHTCLSEHLRVIYVKCDSKDG